MGTSKKLSKALQWLLLYLICTNTGQIYIYIHIYKNGSMNKSYRSSPVHTALVITNLLSDLFWLFWLTYIYQSGSVGCCCCPPIPLFLALLAASSCYSPRKCPKKILEPLLSAFPQQSKDPGRWSAEVQEKVTAVFYTLLFHRYFLQQQ